MDLSKENWYNGAICAAVLAATAPSEKKAEECITNKTKAIVPVHYAGVGCEMDVIMDIASKNNLYVVILLLPSVDVLFLILASS